MIMMKHLIVLGFSILTLWGCSSNDVDNKTTIYEGVLVFEDDLSPVTEATLNFQGRKRVAGIGQRDETIIERDITLSDNGSFRFEIEVTKSNIDYFAVGLYFGENPASIDCSPNSCASLPPRTTLTELRFLAERE